MGDGQWRALAAAAADHRLLWHFAAAIRDGRAPGAPDALAAADLADSLRLAGARSLARVAQARELGDALARDEIPFAFIKGHALAEAAYGDSAARDSVDIDILVSRGDLARAARALASLGYDAPDAAGGLESAVLHATDAHLKFFRGNDAMIEVHWRTASARFPWRPDVESLLRRSSGHRLDALDDVALQATHGARHGWHRLEWLVAFASLVRRSGVSLHDEAAVARFAEWRAAGAVEVAARASDVLLGTSLSLRGTPRPAIARTVARVARRSAAEWQAPATAAHALILGTLDSIAARLRYIVISLFAPTEHERDAVTLRGSWSLLYYPLRVLRVLTGRTAGLRRRPASS